VWYLVAGTDAGQRTFRVDRITSVEPTGEPVERPDGFDLAETWRMVTDEIEQRRTPVRASALCQRDSLWLCRAVLGTRIQIGAADDEGRVRIEIRGHSLYSLAGEIAGLGARLEVVEPPELRNELARIGTELTTTYDQPPAIS
jgi:predicted DNA-binding transcriptional regulator YafY